MGFQESSSVLFFELVLLFFCVLNFSVVTLSKTFFGEVLGKSCLYFLFWFVTQQQGVKGVLGFFFFAGAVFHSRPSDILMLGCAHGLHSLSDYFLSRMMVQYALFMTLKYVYGRINS